MRKFLLCCVVAIFLGGCSDGEPSVDNPVQPSDYSAEKELTKSSSSEGSSSSLEKQSSSSTDKPSSSSKGSSSSMKKQSSSSTDEQSSSSTDEPSSSSEDSSSSMEKQSSSSTDEPSSSSEGSSSSMEKQSSSSTDEPSSSSEGSSSSMGKQSSSSTDEPSSSSEGSSSSMEKQSSSSIDESSSSEYFKSNWKYLDQNVVYDTIVDSRDNQVYKVVTIGTQTWMAENLNYFDEQIADDAICLNNKSSNCEKYGRLYNLPVTLNYDSLKTKPYSYLHSIDSMGVQGICPDGWRIPTLRIYP